MTWVLVFLVVVLVLGAAFLLGFLLRARSGLSEAERRNYTLLGTVAQLQIELAESESARGRALREIATLSTVAEECADEIATDPGRARDRLRKLLSSPYRARRDPPAGGV